MLCPPLHPSLPSKLLIPATNALVIISTCPSPHPVFFASVTLPAALAPFQRRSSSHQAPGHRTTALAVARMCDTDLAAAVVYYRFVDDEV